MFFLSERRDISYSYNASGNRRSVTTPSGTVNYDYDLLDRLTEVTAPDGGSTRYQYDAAGNRSGMTYPNGVRTDYRYNALNRLTDLVQRGPDGVILASYAYTLGAAGNRIKVEEYSGRSVEYAYDSSYKLLSESITEDPLSGGASQTIGYSYDAVGNRLTQTINGVTTNYGYDANDHLLSAGNINYTYDKNGNTLTQTGPAKQVTYSYNIQNRLIRAEILRNGSSSFVEYRYDHDGIRVASILNGTDRTSYLVDKNRPYAQVLEERTGTGDLLAAYVYGDDLISQTRPSAGSGTVTSYYLYDGLGSTRALTNGSGMVTDTYAYEAYGNLLDKSGSTINNYLYTGEQHDPALDFYYLRARYMDPSIGRFSTMDTFEGNSKTPLSLNKYLYGHGDPINNTDPSGFMISVQEQLTAQNIQYELIQIGRRMEFMFDLYDRVTSLADLALGVRQLFQVIHSGSLLGALTSAWDPTQLARIDFQEALWAIQTNLPKIIGTGIGNWTTGYLKTRRTHKMKAYYLYMPGLLVMPPAKLDTRVRINTIPLKLAFGNAQGKLGMLTGAGVEMKGERMLFRMDFHSPNPSHGSRSGVGVRPDEVSHWIDGNFHFHVMKW